MSRAVCRQLELRGLWRGRRAVVTLGRRSFRSGVTTGQGRFTEGARCMKIGACASAGRRVGRAAVSRLNWFRHLRVVKTRRRQSGDGSVRAPRAREFDAAWAERFLAHLWGESAKMRQKWLSRDDGTKSRRPGFASEGPAGIAPQTQNSSGAKLSRVRAALFKFQRPWATEPLIKGPEEAGAACAFRRLL